MSFCKNINRYVQHYIIKYVLLFIWILTLIFTFCKVYHVYFNEPEYYYLRRLLGKGLCIARATAIIINILIIIIMLPVCKTFNIIIHNLLQKMSICCMTLYLEKLKIIHMTFTIGLILVSFIHGTAHIINIFNFIKYYDNEFSEINWAIGPNDNIFRLLLVTPTGFSGCSMLIILLIIWMFSTYKTRERFYNSFYATHHLFIVFFTLMYYHSLAKIFKYQQNIDKHEPEKCIFNVTNPVEKCNELPIFVTSKNFSWIWPTIALSIFLIDRTIRYIKRNSQEVNVVEALQFPGEAIFLRLKLKDTVLEIQPTQYILLQCQNLSVLEWHPFTVTECPSKDDTSFTLLIGARGDWTNDLYRYIANLNRHTKQLNIGNLNKKTKNYHLKFLIDGPFPSPLENMLTKKIVVCCADGVGITPFIAIFNELLKNDYVKPHRIHLVWVIKKVEQILWFSKLFELLLEKFWKENQPDRLEIQFYITNNYSNDRINDLFYTKTSFLKSRIHNGKPCWNTYFDYLGFLYKKSSVSIYGCGSKSLMQRIRSNCNDNNRNGFNYSFLNQKLGEEIDN